MPEETKIEIKFVGTFREFAKYQKVVRETYKRIESHRAKRRFFDNLAQDCKPQFTEFVRQCVNESRRDATQASCNLEACFEKYWSVDIERRSRPATIRESYIRTSILEELKRF